QPDAFGQRLLDDDPRHVVVAVEAIDGRRELLRDGRRVLALDVDERARNADLGAGLQNPLEVDHRRRAAPADDDREARRMSVVRDVGRDVRRDPLPDLGRERRALEATCRRGGGRRCAAHRAVAGSGIESSAARRAPLPTRSWTFEASATRSSSIDLTRRSVALVHSFVPMSGRFTSTFSAAPWPAAWSSSAATRRSDDALTLDRPARASASRSTSWQVSTQRKGTWAATVAVSRICRSRNSLSAKASRGSLSAIAHAAYAAASSRANSSSASRRAVGATCS